MNTDFIPILVALFAADSILVVLVNGWLNRRERRAKANKTQEEAVALDVTTQGDQVRTLQATVGWWEEKYGGVVQRSDALKLELDAISAHFDEFRESANLALENLRDLLAEEQKQRVAQAALIIEIQTQRERRDAAIIELQSKVSEMQLVIDEQAETIRKLRADLVRSSEELCEERALRKQLEERVARFNGVA